MNSDAPPSTEQRPASSQFSLRGLFLLLTAMSVMFAVLALVLRSPLHWLGALLVPVICFGIIGAMELGRRFFPPPPRLVLPRPPFPPLPPNVLLTTYFSDGENPFRQAVEVSNEITSGDNAVTNEGRKQELE